MTCAGLTNASFKFVTPNFSNLLNDQFAADLHFIAENNFGHFGEPWTEFIPAHLKEIREILSDFGKIFAQNPQNIENSKTGKIEEASAWGNKCYGQIFENSKVVFLSQAIKKILEDELKFAGAEKLIVEYKEQDNILITDKDRTR